MEESLQTTGQGGYHWTAASDDDFVHKITFDFIAQVEKRMESFPLTQMELAKKLGVSEAAVSRVLNNPQNLTLKTIVRYARALDIKVALVAYDDHDPENLLGPVDSEIFNLSWQHAGQPHDSWELDNNYQRIITTTLSVHWIATCQLEVPMVSNLMDPWGNFCSVTLAWANIQYVYEECKIPVSLMISRTGSNEIHG